MDNKKLSLGVKFTYGIGDFYGGASVGIIGIFFLYFLTTVVGISPIWGGFIVFFGRAIDAITDPLMGTITDNTKSRYGRRSIWFILGVVPVFLSYTLLWLNPNFSTAWSIVYYLIMYSFFSCAFTFVMVPYGALPQELTPDANERAVLVSFRMAFSIIGGLLAAIIPDIIIKAGPSLSRGHFIMGILFAGVFSIIWIVMFFVMKGREKPVQKGKSINFKASLKYCFNSKAFILLIGIYLLAFLPIDVISTNFKFYLNDVIHKDYMFTTTMGVLMVSAVLSLPLYVMLIKRVGKKKAFIMGSLLRAVLLVALFFVTANTADYLLVAMAVFIGIGTGSSYAIPWAMLPEVTDLDEALTGLRQEGVYTGVMTFIRKLSSGVAILLVGAILYIAGYNKDIDTQQPPAILAIRLIITALPFLLTIAAILCAHRYPIDNKNFLSIRRIIELRRNGQYDKLSSDERMIIDKQLNDIVKAKRGE